MIPFINVKVGIPMTRASKIRSLGFRLDTPAGWSRCTQPSSPAPHFPCHRPSLFLSYTRPTEHTALLQDVRCAQLTAGCGGSVKNAGVLWTRPACLGSALFGFLIPSQRSCAAGKAQLPPTALKEVSKPQGILPWVVFALNLWSLES